MAAGSSAPINIQTPNQALLWDSKIHWSCSGPLHVGRDELLSSGTNEMTGK